MALKPLLFDGSLDGGTVVRHRILIDDLVNDRLITTTDEYRIQHISGYSRSQIGLVLARQADALNFSLPFQQYFSPDFPSVKSEEHTSELQSLMRISYAVFCLKKKK